MNIVEAYKSADGQLHKDKKRAAAADLHHALPRPSSMSNERVLSYSACLVIFDHLAAVKKAIADYEDMGDIGSGARDPDNTVVGEPPMPAKK